MSFTISWNKKSAVFIAKFKKIDSTWGTKQLPKQFSLTQEIDAHHWMRSWYSQYINTFGLNVKKQGISPEIKTLKSLAQKWLDYRYNDIFTKQNTYNGFRLSVNNWILSNNKFDHYNIDDHDLEKDFSPDECIRWISSIRGSYASVYQHVISIRAFFNDSIEKRWINISINPFDQLAVKKYMKKLKQSTSDEKIITYLSEEDFLLLMTTKHKFLLDHRRIKYLLAVTTGLRDHEIQGLMISDVFLSGSKDSNQIPYIHVQRQLDKIGCKPALRYENLVRQKISKNDIKNYPNAIVSNPKRNSKRYIPLHTLTTKALDFWISRGWSLYVGRDPEHDDPLFPVGNIKSIKSTPGNFCHSDSPELLRKDLERVGSKTTFKDTGKPLVFHSLRHTFATFLANAGVEESRISILLGHASSTTAAKHYVAKEVIQSYAHINKLYVPEVLQLRHGVINRSDC